MEGTTTTMMDFTEIFAAIADGLEMILGLCTKFPLNIFIGAAVISIGIGIYKKLKH